MTSTPSRSCPGTGVNGPGLDSSFVTERKNKKRKICLPKPNPPVQGHLTQWRTSIDGSQMVNYLSGPGPTNVEKLLEICCTRLLSCRENNMDHILHLHPCSRNHIIYYFDERDFQGLSPGPFLRIVAAIGLGCLLLSPLDKGKTTITICFLTCKGSLQFSISFHW